jgi:hypothetical protein
MPLQGGGQAQMNPSTDLPSGLIPVPLKGAILLLTAAEFIAGVRREKWWRRSGAGLDWLVGDAA